MRWVVPVMATAALAAEAPRIHYSKSFPGSTPAYVAIIIERDGKAVYKESAEDDQPLQFQLAGGDAGEIFALAEKLDRFRRPLESGLNVAKMGVKTFRWEAGAERHEVQFNYSLEEEARLLHDWFERMTETVMHRVHLERAVRYDKLGVNKVLLQLSVTAEKNRLVAAEQLLPWLDRISKNESFLNMARERAALLAEAIRAGKLRPAAPSKVE